MLLDIRNNSTAIIASSFAVWYVYRWLKRRNQLPLPPGPKPLPLIGNILDVPQVVPWETYHQWAKDHNSDIIHFDVLGSPMVVLDSYEAAFELFERRSTLYSSRPRMPMVLEVLNFGFSFVLMPYGERWRAHRRLLHASFHEQAAKKFRPHQLEANRKLLGRLLVTPQKFDAHLRLMIAQVVMSVTYGLEVESEDDKYVTIAETGIEWFNRAGLPGTYLVDIIPALKYVPAWFPGATFKKQAREWNPDIDAMIEVPLADAKKNIEGGSAKVSFLSTRLQEEDPNDPFAQELTKNVSGIVFAVAADTTVSAMRTFFLSMALYPETQKKAQDEINRVFGPGHLPTFEDMDSLPYVTAVVKETLRHNPVTPLAVPHALTEDDVYKSYRIPAGATVMGNAWAMLRDEKHYPEPHKWSPERFLDEHGRIRTDVRPPESVAFGFGRRTCPGRHFAYSSVWLTAATMLTVFNITKPLDKAGKEVEPCNEYTSTLISALKPFECTIKARSDRSVELIRSAEAALA